MVPFTQAGVEDSREMRVHSGYDISLLAVARGCSTGADVFFCPGLRTYPGIVLLRTIRGGQFPYSACFLLVLHATSCLLTFLSALFVLDLFILLIYASSISYNEPPLASMFLFLLSRRSCFKLCTSCRLASATSARPPMNIMSI